MRLAVAVAALVFVACGGSKSSAPNRDAGALAAKDAAVPDARPRPPDEAQFVGDPYEDKALPAGTVIATAIAPVHVVAIDTSGRVTRTEHAPQGGVVELRGLVTDGTVAYHLLTMHGEAAAVVPGPDAGIRVAIEAPLAETQLPVAAGEVWVTVYGDPDVNDLTLVDIDKLDPVLPGGAPYQTQTETTFRFTGAKPGSIYVAKLLHRTGTHVSRPFLMGTAGVGRTLLATPVPMVQCDANLFRKDQVLRGWTRCDLWSAGGNPRVLAEQLPLPMPAGAAKATGETVWTRPVPPGTSSFAAEYELAVTDHRVDVALEAAIAMARMAITVEAAPTITVTAVTGGTYHPPALGQGEVSHLVYADAIKAGHQLRFVVDGIQPPTPCELLGVARWTATGDPAPAPDVSAKLRDGTEVKLSSLRGKPVLLNLFASWTPPSAQEAPSLIAAHRAFAPLGVQVVVAASDRDWTAVDRLIDPASGVTVWLDPPGDIAYTLGPIANAFGTQRLPETYLIDANGLVRHWVVNSRDWTSPEALACVQTVTQPWTGNVTTTPAPPPPPPNLVGGTLTLPGVSSIPGSSMLILLMEPRGKAYGRIIVDNPVFPQGFAFRETDLLVPLAALPRTDLEIAVHIDNVFAGSATAKLGDLGVQLTLHR